MDILIKKGWIAFLSTEKTLSEVAGSFSLSHIECKIEWESLILDLFLELWLLREISSIVSKLTCVKSFSLLINNWEKKIENNGYYYKFYDNDHLHKGFYDEKKRCKGGPLRIL